MTKKNLYQLAYLSAATTEPSHEDLVSILDVSVANNEANQITGFLMYVEQSFFQVIEGPQEAIGELYAKLLQDSRHCRVTLLLTSPIDNRRFADWSMAFMHYDRLEDVPVKGYSSYLHDYLSSGKSQLNFVESHDSETLEYMIDSMRANLTRT
jgi:hypothetical protein